MRICVSCGAPLIYQISNLAQLTAASPNESLLAELRSLEKKMGLVLTLVRVLATTIVPALTL